MAVLFLLILVATGPAQAQDGTFISTYARDFPDREDVADCGGAVVGPRASREELAECRERIRNRPANYISQPMVELSVCPTLTGKAVEPRHVDLRPYIITGRSSWVLPGGLTRVALPKGSLIVNSSRGGGTKDTWVLE